MARPVERWLDTFMCGQYADTFEKYGYKTLQSVCQLEYQHVHSMGVLPEHCRKIMENVYVLKQSYMPGDIGQYSNAGPVSSTSASSAMYPDSSAYHAQHPSAVGFPTSGNDNVTYSRTTLGSDQSFRQPQAVSTMYTAGNTDKPLHHHSRHPTNDLSPQQVADNILHMASSGYQNNTTYQSRSDSHVYSTGNNMSNYHMGSVSQGGGGVVSPSSMMHPSGHANPGLWHGSQSAISPDAHHTWNPESSQAPQFNAGMHRPSEHISPSYYHAQQTGGDLPHHHSASINARDDYTNSSSQGDLYVSPSTNTNFDPLQSLQRLVMLPDSQVVDPKSVVNDACVDDHSTRDESKNCSATDEVERQDRDSDKESRSSPKAQTSSSGRPKTNDPTEANKLQSESGQSSQSSNQHEQVKKPEDESKMTKTADEKLIECNQIIDSSHSDSNNSCCQSTVQNKHNVIKSTEIHVGDFCKGCGVASHSIPCKICTTESQHTVSDVDLKVNGSIDSDDSGCGRDSPYTSATVSPCPRFCKNKYTGNLLEIKHLSPKAQLRLRAQTEGGWNVSPLHNPKSQRVFDKKRDISGHDLCRSKSLVGGLLSVCLKPSPTLTDIIVAGVEDKYSWKKKAIKDNSVSGAAKVVCNGGSSHSGSTTKSPGACAADCEHDSGTETGMACDVDCMETSTAEQATEESPRKRSSGRKQSNPRRRDAGPETLRESRDSPNIEVMDMVLNDEIELSPGKSRVNPQSPLRIKTEQHWSSKPSSPTKCTNKMSPSSSIEHSLGKINEPSPSKYSKQHSPSKMFPSKSSETRSQQHSPSKRSPSKSIEKRSRQYSPSKMSPSKRSQSSHLFNEEPSPSKTSKCTKQKSPPKPVSLVEQWSSKLSPSKLSPSKCSVMSGLSAKHGHTTLTSPLQKSTNTDSLCELESASKQAPFTSDQGGSNSETPCGSDDQSKSRTSRPHRRARSMVWDIESFSTLAQESNSEDDADYVPMVKKVKPSKKSAKNDADGATSGELQIGSNILTLPQPSNSACVPQVKQEFEDYTTRHQEDFSNSSHDVGVHSVKSEPESVCSSMTKLSGGRPKGSKNKVKRLSKGEMASKTSTKRPAGRSRKSDCFADAEDDASIGQLKKSLKTLNNTRQKITHKGIKNRGPVIRVSGSSHNPSSCKVINIKDNDTGDKSSIERTQHTQSALQFPLDSSVPFLCAFCGECSSMDGLGALFGPYWPDNYTPPSITSQNSSTATKTETAALTKRKRRSNETVIKSQRSNEVDVPECSAGTGSPERWVHVECAVWCHGVYMLAGKLQGLEEAVQEAKQTVCSECSRTGATVGCITKSCSKKYHYPCTITSDCYLDEENFSIICAKHKGKRLKMLLASRDAPS